MKEDNIVNIIEDYFEARKNKSRISDKEIEDKLISIGVNKDKTKDLILRIDDEWTNEEFQLIKLKKAKQGVIVGYIILVLSLIASIASFFNLFQGRIVVVFYGAIAAGIISIAYASAGKNKIENDRRKRKIVWKNWC